MFARGARDEIGRNEYSVKLYPFDFLSNFIRKSLPKPRISILVQNEITLRQLRRRHLGTRWPWATISNKQEQFVLMTLTSERKNVFIGTTPYSVAEGRISPSPDFYIMLYDAPRSCVSHTVCTISCKMLH